MNKNTADILNLLSKLTFRRFLNFGKVISGYYWSRFTGRAHVFGMPFSVSIEPTTSCNLRCPECPSGLRSFSRPTGMLEKQFYTSVIDQLFKDSMYVIFYFQGEPYLNTDFLQMVNYAHSKRMYSATSTNAHYLNDENAKKTVESGLDRLIISIDGTSQEVYEQYRIGGQLSKVIEGTKNIVKWKKTLKSKTPYVVFQFLVVAPNEHQITDAENLAKELGVDDIAFKTAQINDYQNGSALIPINDHYSRYKKAADGTFQLKNKLMNHCWKVWQSAVITWDGKVVPCCFDKDATHQIGNLAKEQFKEVWKGKEFIQFRQSLLKSRKEIDICQNCSEGGKIWT
ncbi:MAG: SPASM domain-containing protein [Bacteroidia bacterium]|nr:SPASM domain-containing protein [Bacteroidia bacterium]MBP9923260.1 SPASM domain-containing protein [Bacteroidia bacterium]